MSGNQFPLVAVTDEIFLKIGSIERLEEGKKRSTMNGDSTQL